MVNINQMVQLNIISQNYECLGVAKIDDLVVFVEGAIKGETVLAKITKITNKYSIAKLVEVLKPSADRVKPKCAYFGSCGGCKMLHMKYDATLALKLDAFNETLKRIGNIDYEVKEIYGMDNPFAYRNKIQMPASMSNNKLYFGYYKNDSHQVVPIEECLIQSDNVTDVINFIKNLCREFKISSYNEETKSGIVRHILVRENYLGQLMIALVVNNAHIPYEKEIVNKITNRYKNVISIIKNINQIHNNVILGKQYEVLFGKDEIVDQILGINFKISHQSFFQVNRIQTNKLYSIILEYLGNEASNLKVIDAYCGVGSISLCLAKKVKHVYGIEVVKEAIDNAKENALFNGIDNVDFFCTKVEDKIGDLINNDIDAVVVDPPRKGLDKNVIDAIINNKIKKVIYVSCNPATLARDLTMFSSNYDIDNIKLVDLFCYSEHIETVVCLERK